MIIDVIITLGIGCLREISFTPYNFGIFIPFYYCYPHVQQQK